MFAILGGILGYVLYRFPGAIAGYFLGTLIDGMMGKGKKTGGFFGQGQRPGGQRPFGRPQQTQRSNPNPTDFELHLISLSSIVIKADGKVTQQELDYVRQYFVRAYGKDRANNTFRIFNEQIKNREVSASRICDYLNARTTYETRLQLLHFLFGIAQADGSISNPELRTLQSIAGYLSLTSADFVSIKNMFVREQDNAYKILEISKSASNDEVKKAYRTMAKKYHPDKVVSMGEAHQKMAEEKFKEVQRAYEQIQKERGI